MPPFFTSRASSNLTSPIVVSVPHAGLRLPESRIELMMLPTEVYLRDVDYAIDAMWSKACEARDISFIKCEVHRYAIDLNRRTDQVDSFSVRGPRAPGAKPNPKALIWTESTRKEPLNTTGEAFEPISPETLAELIRLVWRPYYDFIERELARVKEKFGFAILIDGHSMPSKGTAFHADPGGSRADVVPGDNKGKSCAPRLTETAVKVCLGQKFSASPNDPYSGGNITQHFGRPGEGIHALQIEINRSIYLEEESPGKPLKAEGLSRLERLAEALLAEATAAAHL